MSGGHFNYDQSRILNIAEEINAIIRGNDDKSLNKWGDPVGFGFSPEVISKFKEGERILRTAYIYAQRIDWLVCADDGEESFLRRLNEDMMKI